MAIEDIKGTLGIRSFTSVRKLEPGVVIQFTYEGEQKYALVLNPRWQGKLHGLSLQDVDINKFIRIRQLVGEETNGEALYSKFRASTLVTDRPYRTYLLSKVSALREVYVKPFVVYRKPNFVFEWGEAKRYPELEALGQSGWLRLAETGTVVEYKTIKRYLGNTDAADAETTFTSLDKDRVNRFLTAFETGEIEYPIAIKFSNTDYDLVAGNTRLTGLVYKGIDPKLWVIDIGGLSNVENMYGE